VSPSRVKKPSTRARYFFGSANLDVSSRFSLARLLILSGVLLVRFAVVRKHVRDGLGIGLLFPTIFS
jgi:hypothetical protein